MRLVCGSGEINIGRDKMSEYVETFSIPNFWEQASPHQVKDELSKDASLVLKSGTPALCLAALYSFNPDVLAVLLDHGADINAASTALTSEGDTALHCAVNSAHPTYSIVQFLLDRGADVSATDAKGNTPLHAALSAPYQAQLEIVQVLLDKAADINAANRNGFTPLHCAAERRDESVIRLLIGAGADVSLQTKAGETACDVAVRYGAGFNVRQLLCP